jgi:hypothetical protein
VFLSTFIRVIYTLCGANLTISMQLRTLQSSHLICTLTNYRLIMDDGDEAAVTDLYDGDAAMRRFVDLHLVYMDASLRKHPLFIQYGIQMVYPIKYVVQCNVIRPFHIVPKHVRTNFTLVVLCTM